VDLFQSDNLNRKMILRNKLRSIQMSRSDNVTSYFMRITQTRDQLAAIGEKVDDVELVNVALNGFTKSWEPFVKGICAREKLPNWERLWDDCIQEETREESKASKQGDGEENLALVSQAKKGKGKGSKGNSEGETSQPGKKKDLSKIKCFACHKSGHYASQCPEKKKGQGKSQQVATSTETQLDEFAAKFECCRLIHTWETWKKSSIHSVCPWGQVRVKVLSPNPQLLRLGQLLAKPRGVVPNKYTKA
jgi:hypothetical protein